VNRFSAGILQCSGEIDVKLQIQSDQSGSALVMVMIFFLIFTVVGTAYLSLSALEASSSVAQVQRTRAFILAESALCQSLWRINHGNDLLGTFNQDSLIADYDSLSYLLTAEGNSGNTTCQLKIQLQNDHPFNHVVGYQTSLDTLHYFMNHLPNHGIEQFSEMPDLTPVLNYYNSIADYYYYGDQPFYGLMEPGIHYVDGRVVMHNGTFLNGTLIATAGVKFLGTVTIIAQKDSDDSTRYYPAIIAGDTARTEIDISGNPQLTVYGAIFCTGCAIFLGKSISGPIVAPEIVLKGWVHINDWNDPYLYALPAGFELPEIINSKKIIVRGSWQETGYM
jgi:Tfp pilus assembly protein PilX